MSYSCHRLTEQEKNTDTTLNLTSDDKLFSGNITCEQWRSGRGVPGRIYHLLKRRSIIKL